MRGDDKNARGRWVSTASGTGDGVIQGVYTASASGTTTDATKESGFFWHHLRLAGFVSGTGAEQPFNAVSGRIGVQTSDGTAPGSGAFATGALTDGGGTPTKVTALRRCVAKPTG